MLSVRALALWNAQEQTFLPIMLPSHTNRLLLCHPQDVPHTNRGGVRWALAAPRNASKPRLLRVEKARLLRGMCPIFLTNRVCMPNQQTTRQFRLTCQKRSATQRLEVAISGVVAPPPTVHNDRKNTALQINVLCKNARIWW